MKSNHVTQILGPTLAQWEYLGVSLDPLGGASLRSRWLLLLGIATALAGGVLTYEYLRALDRRVQVVVAARDLYPREIIEPRDIRICRVPSEALHPDALRSAAEARGRLVTQAIYVGEQIHISRTDLGMAGRTVYGLEPAQRAMFVQAGFARGAGGSLQPGDCVDLIAVISGRGDQVAYRLALDLQVLELRDERGNLLTDSGSRAGLGGVLLAVPDSQVESIALALSCGHVYVVLRGTRHPAAGAPPLPHKDVIPQ